MTDFFRKHIQEIQNSGTLRVYGIFLNLTHVVTFFYWNQSSFFINTQSSLNSDPLCYPFFPDCDLFEHFIPKGMWQIILFFYLFTVLCSIWFFLNQNQTKKAYFSLILGTLIKLTLYLSNYYFTSSYHFMVHLVLLLYFFASHKKINIQYLIVAFYMASGFSKINSDWLSVFTPFNVPRVSHQFPILPPVYVIFLESFLILSLFSNYKWLRRLTLLQLLIFHILSAFNQGPYEPLLMLCLLGFFLVDEFFNSSSQVFENRSRPGLFVKKFLEPKENSHLNLFFNGKENFSTYLCLLVFTILQFIPSMLVSEPHLSGLPQLFSLNLSGSKNQCKALMVTHQKGQSAHLEGPVVKGLETHLRCDPIVYLNQAYQLCRKNRKSKEFEKLSLSLVSKRISESQYKKILDIPDVCQLKHPLWAEFFQDEFQGEKL